MKITTVAATTLTGGCLAAALTLGAGAAAADTVSVDAGATTATGQNADASLEATTPIPGPEDGIDLNITSDRVVLKVLVGFSG